MDLTAFYAMPDQATVPMSWVRAQVLGPIEEDAAHHAVIYATALYWAAVIGGLLPLPLRRGGASSHTGATNLMPQDEMNQDGTLPRHHFGIRGLNRVTVFKRADSSYWYIEWWQYQGPEQPKKRMVRSMAYVTDGTPIVDEAAARSLGAAVAEQLQAKAAHRVLEQARARMYASPDLSGPTSPGTAGLVGIEYAAPNPAVAPAGATALQAAKEEKEKTWSELRAEAIARDESDGLAVNTKSGYKTMYNKIVAFFGEKLKKQPSEVMEEDIRAFKQALVDPKEEGGFELGEKRANRALRKLSSFIEEAMYHGYVEKDPMRKIKLYRNIGGRSEEKIYGQEELDLLLETLARLDREGSEDYDLKLEFHIWTTWDSGLRITEQTLLEATNLRIVMLDDGTEIAEFYSPKKNRKNVGKATVDAHGRLISPRAVEVAKRILELPEMQGEEGRLYPNLKGRTKACHATKEKGKEVRTALHHLETIAGVETVEGRAFHPIKHRFAVRWASIDELRYASFVAGTKPRTLSKIYDKQDEIRNGSPLKRDGRSDFDKRVAAMILTQGGIE